MASGSSDRQKYVRKDSKCHVGIVQSCLQIRVLRPKSYSTCASKREAKVGADRANAPRNKTSSRRVESLFLFKKIFKTCERFRVPRPGSRALSAWGFDPPYPAGGGALF